jgi:hypothetical protein
MNSECLNTLRFDNTRVGKISPECEDSLQWLWVHEQYQGWSSTNSSDLLLIEGKPGSGKSTLTKYFKRNLLEREPLARQAAVAGFFYSNREGDQQTSHSNMLRSILFDVLDQNETFFFHFQSYYRQALQSDARFRWSYDSLKDILRDFGNHPAEERLYLIVDAMDESNEEDRRDTIRLLRRLCSATTPCIKVFLASRPTAGLNQIHRIIRLQDENRPDISKFTQSFLDLDLELPPEILHHATEYIVQHAQGVFVWVHLVREELLKYAERGVTKKEIFAFLESLPTELEGLYRRILGELEGREERDIKVGVRMFRLVLFAHRPLGLEELRQALAITDDLGEFSPSDESFEDELILGFKQSIIHCGGNFLEIKGTPPEEPYWNCLANI